MGWALFITGLTSVIGQVILVREMAAVFYGNELSLGLILAVWLLWVAVGAWGLGRLAGRGQPGPRTVGWGLAANGFILLAQLVAVRTARLWLNVTPGAVIGLGSMFLTALLVLAPLCLSLGVLFRLGASLIASVGAAYVWEAAGAAAGGAVFAFLLVRWLDPFSTALLVGAANWAGAFWVSRGQASRRPDFTSGVLILGMLAWAACALTQGNAWHLATLRWQYGDLLFAHDSVYGRLVVTGHGSQRVFFENGLVTLDTESLAAEEIIHPPLLAHPEPRRLLLVGGGISGGLREALKHPLGDIDYVELDPLTIETARRFLPAADAALLEAPRVHLISADGRRYLLDQATAPSPPYDVVIVDLPEPSTGQLNRFYTQEFFQQARSALKPDGILALGLPSAENYLNRELRRRNGSVYATLRSVFPHLLVLPGDRNIFLASGAPLPDDPGVWAARLGERGISTRQMTAPYLRFLLTGERYQNLKRTLEADPGQINRDFAPICYYYDMVLWLSRFYGEPGTLFDLPLLRQVGLPGLVALLLVAVLRWRPRWRVPGAIALAGLAGMGAEVVLLLAFQSLSGYVYFWVSLIVAAFMVGSTVGAGWAERRGWQSRSLLGAVMVGLAFYMWLLPLILQALPTSASWLVPALALLGGSLVGGAFPLAVKLSTGEAGHRAGLIYGADLVGGCLGALLTAVLWVPLLGLPTTCLVVGLWVVAGAVSLL